ncbi:SPFH domain-containing protein [Ornithobacterium rhinotracheale]|uniref:SPFH domain-containing protein n=1 Tax=Ornithobacterium rhinotracheale TaxID=28251 RepID=UPI001FF15FF0|nr:SPFH domain-containing protein [Ornithobacterium rhinotracheale]MCK0200662.1 SPFH domain-containing protein [Ornithobacterium rhinotracheale]MCK0201399.1 SPFH domain-containing protein [Ornithobacterium rhinotracheale]
MKKYFYLTVLYVGLIVAFNSCSRVEPNYEGVLMENYGRNGKEDFHTVVGRQWVIFPGTSLYQVPMFETSGDPKQVTINAKDAGVFQVDPSYQYQAIRGKGIDIVFNYKHLGITEPEVMMNNVEEAILNKLVINAYREEARNYTTDSLMNNLNKYEKQVEERLKVDFANKYFQLNNLTSGLKPPASMSKAIEARNNAIQQAERVRNELQVSKMNLEKAKIDAEANRVRAQGLDSKILQEQWIDAIKETKNKVIITDGRTPVILN